MKDMLFRFAIVWIVLHIILFFIERYRYKHSHYSWYGFKTEGMLYITYFILCIDKAGILAAIIMGLGYWILQPINT